MTTTPDPRTARYAAASRRVVTQAGDVVLHANKEISKGTYDFAQWSKSVNELVNLVLTAGLQLSAQMIPIPCIPKATEEYGLSDFITTAPDDKHERLLTVAEKFVQPGAPSSVIPAEFIGFEPAILPRNATKFRIKVYWPNLRSGTYRGRIRLTRIPTAADAPHDPGMGVVIDL